MRGLHAAAMRLADRHRTREQLHEYWRSAADENAPELYATEGDERSEFLVHLVRQHGDIDSSILELGCNVGRNLEHLRAAGFRHLTGVEISQRAIDVMVRTYPELTASADIRVGTLEDTLPQIAGGFDVVFTMAVLEHIHDDSARVFGEMVRITAKRLITVEDETSYSWRHFPRNYGRVFGALGLRQLDEIKSVPGAPRAFVARVFARA